MHFTPQRRNLDWLLEKPIAHRGLHDEKNGIVENSAAAFAAAIKHGCSIECDLQLTADRKAVVFHDNKVDRILAGSGPVKSHTVHDIQSLSFRGGSDRVQTLEELLEQVSGKQTLLIEIKSLWDNDTTLTHYALDVLARYSGPFAIMSFDENLITYAAQHFPQIVRGLTWDRCTDPYYDFMPESRRLARKNLTTLPQSKPDFLSYYFRDLPFAPVSELREQGMPILTWTIENQAQADQARQHSDQITFENFIPK